MSIDAIRPRAPQKRDFASNLACMATTLLGLGAAAILIKALIDLVS